VARVLVVDDEPGIRTALVRGLGAEGFQERVTFHKFLQWQIDAQLANAHRAALDQGVP
jgi:4-alpha-glucanotransferase